MGVLEYMGYDLSKFEDHWFDQLTDLTISADGVSFAPSVHPDGVMDIEQ